MMRHIASQHFQLVLDVMLEYWDKWQCPICGAWRAKHLREIHLKTLHEKVELVFFVLELQDDSLPVPLSMRSPVPLRNVIE